MPYSKSTFPQITQFDIRPTQLMAAVDTLPEAKVKSRKPKLMLEKLRRKLLQISIKDVSNWRLKPAVLNALPYLAAEQKNKALLERVIALTLGSMSDMPERILIRLLPFIIDNEQVRQKAHGRFSKSSPSDKAPIWVAKHWRTVLKPADPALTMARILIQMNIPLASALKSIELDSTSPFADAVLNKMWVEMEPQDLQQQPFEESLYFIARSGQALHTRRLFLTWMLNTYSVRIESLADIDIDQPQRLLLETALTMYGRPDRSAWRDCDTKTLKWAWHVHHDTLLNSSLESIQGWGRADFWRRYIQEIRVIKKRSTDGLLIIDLGNVIAIENLKTARECTLFDREHFMSRWNIQKWAKQSLRLPVPVFKLIRNAPWEGHLARQLRDISGFEGEDWS